jgi:hypothetical protein
MSAALSLFDPPPVQPLTAAQRKADVIAWLWRLVPLAIEMAYAAGIEGITVSDLRLEAERRGLITGEESRTRGSYLWRVMPMARLAKTDRFRRSDVPRAHRNVNVVHVAPEYARAA